MKPEQTDPETEVPMTEVEIERKPFEAQEHDWLQQGYSLICPGTNCSMQPYQHGANIKPGEMLTGKRGEWKLVQEGTRMKQ